MCRAHGRVQNDQVESVILGWRSDFHPAKEVGPFEGMGCGCDCFRFRDQHPKLPRGPSVTAVEQRSGDQYRKEVSRNVPPTKEPADKFL